MVIRYHIEDMMRIITAGINAKQIITITKDMRQTSMTLLTWKTFSAVLHPISVPCPLSLITQQNNNLVTRMRYSLFVYSALN